MKCLFGRIRNDEMLLNPYGEIAREEWLRIPSVRPEVQLDEFVIMPNHLHGILIVNAAFKALTDSAGACHAPLQRHPRTLGAIVGGFKSVCTSRINRYRGHSDEPVWQRGYYEHIIRNEDDLSEIRDYIITNPFRWDPTGRPA